ncbi:RAD55 family ATPase [Halobaculum halobium]|uniref:RAD55 family ATPase n=2 Tax=Halobaculum halobium TaxID=3032281 RepID=A0ABD5T9U9_9EURY|nr:ATPase domain-containing protein [Halobaculum sp. SYNS20]
MTDETAASLGDEVLDRMLRGGLPRGQATLVRGGPGTGKSTLSMQFLDAGVQADERCLYVTTEQTLDDVADSFAAFPFALDDDRLDVLSLHATPGVTLEDPEGDDDAMTLQRLDDDAAVGGTMSFGEYTRELTPATLREEFQRYEDYDRVVVDSANGIAGFTDTHTYRRVLLDVIATLTDRGDATLVFTAEEGGDDSVGDLLQYAVHGVVSLTRDRIREDNHRFVEIAKLRGVDHDTRRLELHIDAERGARAVPGRRSQPPAVKTHGHRPIGIDGFDRLVGGGVVAGAGVLFEHDGTANVSTFLGSFLDAALARGDRLAVVPTIHLRPHGLETILSGFGHDVGALLADGRLHVVDLIGTWDADRDGVHAPSSGEGVREAFGAIRPDDAGDDDTALTSIVNADAYVNALSAEEARELRYYEESQLVRPTDTLVHVHNPGTAADEVTAFLENTAEQVIETWLSDTGLQYVHLRKSPCGFVGTTSLVEYLETEPYVAVQGPPSDRENPMAAESYPDEYPSGG